MIITWKVSPTNVGESVSARMTLCEVAMYSFFHLQRFSVHHYASPCQWPPSQSSEWQYSPSWSSARATIIVRVTIDIIMIISESGKHLQSDNHHQSDSSHHQDHQFVNPCQSDNHRQRDNGHPLDHQWGDLAISGWMSLKLLVTTLLAIVKKPGASTDWTVNKVRNSFFQSYMANSESIILTHSSDCLLFRLSFSFFVLLLL